MRISNPELSEIKKTSYGYVGVFRCMASECQVLIGSHSKKLALQLTDTIMNEALRIEGKYSRYNNQSVVGLINGSKGAGIEVDSETQKLLDYAQVIYQLSDGAFDITTGVLNKLWRFDGSSNVPTKESISELMNCVGWGKVLWNNPVLTLPTDMAIDFGGIGKEYAVDSAFAIASRLTNKPFLVNFGGDLRASGVPVEMDSWTVGIDINTPSASNAIAFHSGGLATSGDKNRFLLKQGLRYSHILDARTGWPVRDAPSSVTVAAATCVEAGMLATLASLKGPDAEVFLKEQEVKFLINR